MSDEKRRRWFGLPTMPGHAESHNELASMLDIHLSRPVQPTDTLDGHMELHEQIRQRIVELQRKGIGL